jgi:hypothetical protein
MIEIFVYIWNMDNLDIAQGYNIWSRHRQVFDYQILKVTL